VSSAGCNPAAPRCGGSTPPVRTLGWSSGEPPPELRTGVRGVSGQHARLPTSRGRFESDRMLHTRPKCFRWHTTLPGWKGGFESRRSLTASSFIGEDTALSRQKDGFDSRRGRLASPGIQSTVPEPASDIRWWCSWEHVALIRRRGLVRLRGSVLATGETGSHLSYKQEFRVRLPGCLRGRGCNGKPAALAPRAIPVRIWASPSGQLGVTDEHTRLVSVEVGVRIL
jgi:hypothetical protein